MFNQPVALCTLGHDIMHKDHSGRGQLQSMVIVGDKDFTGKMLILKAKSISGPEKKSRVQPRS